MLIYLLLCFQLCTKRNSPCPPPRSPEPLHLSVAGPRYSVGSVRRALPPLLGSIVRFSGPVVSISIFSIHVGPVDFRTSGIRLGHFIPPCSSLLRRYESETDRQIYTFFAHWARGHFSQKTEIVIQLCREKRWHTYRSPLR